MNGSPSSGDKPALEKDLENRCPGTPQSTGPSCALTSQSFESVLFFTQTSGEYPCWIAFNTSWKSYSLGEFLAQPATDENERIAQAMKMDVYLTREEAIKEVREEEAMAAREKDAANSNAAKNLALQTIAWLNQGVSGDFAQWLNEDEKKFTARAGVADDFKILPSLLNSTLISDVVYAREQWPLICFEIQSGGEYQKTVAKLIGVCIDQLRLFMNANNTITETCGFALPKNDEKAAVTECWVTWTNFRFDIKFRLLSKEAARVAVSQRMAEMRKLYSAKLEGRYPRSCTLLPLATSELKAFGYQATQIRSNSAIVVHSPAEQLYYKWYYNTPRWKVKKAKSLAVVKPLGTRDFGSLKFQVFPEVDRSLSRWDSVREHCVEYVRLLHAALESLHREDQMAHLDVRIENTCFSLTPKQAGRCEAEYKLLLLDLDRSQPVTNPVSDLHEKYVSNLYASEATWTCGQLDFKQLGILIALVLDETLTVEQPLPEKSGISPALQPVYPLLCALIQQGKWDQEAFDKWSDSRPKTQGGAPQDCKQ